MIGLRNRLLGGACIAGKCIVAACIFTATMTGCASEQPTPSGMSAKPNAKNSGKSSTPEPLNKPAGLTRSTRVKAAILPLGPIPYDNMVLPIISPDGVMAATQAGASPTWATLLAEPTATLPQATRVEIYRFDLRENLKAEERQPPAMVTTLTETVLLGRSCDSEGFLVESPREDGSRWIGKASWRTGDITWLVNDDSVNAFASLGPGGRLAWSRRTKDGEHFELVIRRSAGRAENEWTLSGLAEDWLMPVWSGRGDNLFVVHFDRGRLDIRYGMATVEPAFRQSMQAFSIASNTTRSVAYDLVSGEINVADSPTPPREQLVYAHPGLNRIAFWRPLAESGKKARYLNADSKAAVVDEDEYALVTTTADLLRQSLKDPNERAKLVAGTQIVRPTSQGNFQYMLLSPAEGRIGLAAMRLLPLETQAAAKPGR